MEAAARPTRGVNDLHGDRSQSPHYGVYRELLTGVLTAVRIVHPPRGTFSGSASQIARTMSRKNVSPGGVGSGIRMIQYFINRAGRKLSASRRAELERAKRLLQRRAASRKATARKN